MDDKDYLYDLLVHDLRGPLSVVAVTTSSLLNKAERYGALTDQQKHSLERILRNTKRAQAILNEVLDVGRSQEKIFKAEPFTFFPVLKESLLNVMELVDESSMERLQKAKDEETLKNMASELGVSIEISGPYRKTPFVHDRRKVQLIIENLMSNAMKYRKKSMKVSVSGERDAIITVSDDGAGIPKNEQDVIYGRFAQCSNADQPDMRGLGLGLFCVKALVQAMAGGITLTSIEGSGTNFVVTIPRLGGK
jgi:signal transduction histidine kinase